MNDFLIPVFRQERGKGDNGVTSGWNWNQIIDLRYVFQDCENFVRSVADDFKPVLKHKNRDRCDMTQPIISLC